MPASRLASPRSAMVSAGPGPQRGAVEDEPDRELADHPHRPVVSFVSAWTSMWRASKALPGAACRPSISTELPTVTAPGPTALSSDEIVVDGDATTRRGPSSVLTVTVLANTAVTFPSRDVTDCVVESSSW